GAHPAYKDPFAKAAEPTSPNIGVGEFTRMFGTPVVSENAMPHANPMQPPPQQAPPQPQASGPGEFTRMFSAPSQPMQAPKPFGIKQLSDFEDIPDRDQVEPWDKDATGVLMRLFIETRFIPEAVVREKLGDTDTDLLEELGLVHGSEENDTEVWSPVSLVPF